MDIVGIIILDYSAWYVNLLMINIVLTLNGNIPVISYVYHQLSKLTSLSVLFRKVLYLFLELWLQMIPIDISIIVYRYFNSN